MSLNLSDSTSRSPSLLRFNMGPTGYTGEGKSLAGRGFAKHGMTNSVSEPLNSVRSTFCSS
uniref:Uncharacterized protein n=1 Tax=Salix viminalis TaxID=40686 RepID=A0A6N2LE72_SALVM